MTSALPDPGTRERSFDPFGELCEGEHAPRASRARLLVAVALFWILALACVTGRVVYGAPAAHGMPLSVALAPG